MAMATTMEDRLRRLEQSNKRLKAAMLAMGTLATGVVLLGATTPIPVSKVIKAERFVLMDAAGKERAELSANDDAAALQFLNRNGSRGVIIANGSAGNGVLISDKAGKSRVNLFTSDDGTASMSLVKPNTEHEAFLVRDTPEGTVLTFRDGNEKDRLDLGYTAKGASLLIADANETSRAMIGEQGVMTFKKGGQIQWASFGEEMTPEERKHVMDLVNSTLPQ